MQRNSGQASIRFQLFRLVLAVSAIALAFSVIGGALLEWKLQYQQIRQSLATTARAAGMAASAAIAFHDKKAAGEALHILAAQKEIEVAAVYPLEGYRLASYGDDADLPDTIGSLSEHLPSFALWSPSTTLFIPILLDGATIGHIYLRASLHDYHRIYLEQAFLAISTNLLGLILAIGFGLRFIRHIVKPINDLAHTARQVRESKDFSLRATPPEAGAPNNEITELLDSFNAMLTEIELREQMLTNYQSSLERRVLERTEDLHSANRDLLVAKESAEAATQAKSRFLAAASHDLRQPIQAINLFNEALNRTALSNEQKSISNFLGQSIRNLGELFDALLDISKLDAGANIPRPEMISVHTLFSGIDSEFSALASAKSLRFKLHFPFNGMTLDTDGKLLQRLLRNLVGNAIKYTTQGGVMVAIRRRGDEALIQVIDTGIGIAPQHVKTIFEEYFQVGNPERDKSKGLGLGLAITKRLASLLNTKIVCRSDLGKGSVFEFRLPLAHT